MTSPTRGQNILDLFLTTNPTLVDNVSITPGLSDHDVVLIQVNVKPEVLKQVPRNIHLYKKADWDQLKQSMREVYVELKQSDLATTTVQSMWDRFAPGLEQGIEKFIPVRKAGTRDGFPWVNQEIHRLMRKRDKLYKRWSRSDRPYDQSRFIEYKHLVRQVSDRAYKKYLGDILGLNNDQEDQNEGQNQKTLFTDQAFQAGLQWHCSLEGGWPNSSHRNSKRKCLKRPMRRF